MFKFLKYILLGLGLLFVGALLVLKLLLPHVGPAENLSIELTHDKIQRGAYLANYVCVCTDCHSRRDWSRFSGPIAEGTLGMGGQEFNQTMGFPGIFYSRNITPAGLGKWTDGEILRAIASGVSRDGNPLFPVMPHASYGRMDREDLGAIIAYLRSLDPIDNEVPTSQPDFPMSLMINMIPKAASYSTKPDKRDITAYGGYLFNAAVCAECHTKQERGKPVTGLELAGGFEFPLVGGGIVRSANITPDIETGIGSWSESDFIKKFKSYSDLNYLEKATRPGEFNTWMPWTMYGKMTEFDLKAIYQFLRTQKPIKHEVIKFSNRESLME